MSTSPAASSRRTTPRSSAWRVGSGGTSSPRPSRRSPARSCQNGRRWLCTTTARPAWATPSLHATSSPSSPVERPSASSTASTSCRDYHVAPAPRARCSSTSTSVAPCWWRRRRRRRMASRASGSRARATRSYALYVTPRRCPTPSRRAACSATWGSRRTVSAPSSWTRGARSTLPIRFARAMTSGRRSRGGCHRSRRPRGASPTGSRA
mmetsp:Transcript_22175/g.47912  ORF Transcript_22175/g.47912 Transcript_22175/m.47912 type:complete len:209 (-) Transcript_22175:734-1360(-)